MMRKRIQKLLLTVAFTPMIGMAFIPGAIATKPVQNSSKLNQKRHDTSGSVDLSFENAMLAKMEESDLMKNDNLEILLSSPLSKELEGTLIQELKSEKTRYTLALKIIDILKSNNQINVEDNPQFYKELYPVLFNILKDQQENFYLDPKEVYPVLIKKRFSLDQKFDVSNFILKRIKSTNVSSENSVNKFYYLFSRHPLADFYLIVAKDKEIDSNRRFLAATNIMGLVWRDKDMALKALDANDAILQKDGDPVKSLKALNNMMRNIDVVGGPQKKARMNYCQGSIPYFVSLLERKPDMTLQEKIELLDIFNFFHLHFGDNIRLSDGIFNVLHSWYRSGDKQVRYELANRIFLTDRLSTDFREDILKSLREQFLDETSNVSLIISTARRIQLFNPGEKEAIGDHLFFLLNKKPINSDDHFLLLSEFLRLKKAFQNDIINPLLELSKNNAQKELLLLSAVGAVINNDIPYDQKYELNESKIYDFLLYIAQGNYQKAQGNYQKASPYNIVKFLILKMNRHSAKQDKIPLMKMDQFYRAIKENSHLSIKERASTIMFMEAGNLSTTARGILEEWLTSTDSATRLAAAHAILAEQGHNKSLDSEVLLYSAIAVQAEEGGGGGPAKVYSNLKSKLQGSVSAAFPRMVEEEKVITLTHDLFTPPIVPALLPNVSREDIRKAWQDLLKRRALTPENQAEYDKAIASYTRIDDGNINESIKILQNQVESPFLERWLKGKEATEKDKQNPLVVKIHKLTHHLLSLPTEPEQGSILSERDWKLIYFLNNLNTCEGGRKDRVLRILSQIEQGMTKNAHKEKSYLEQTGENYYRKVLIESERTAREEILSGVGKFMRTILELPGDQTVSQLPHQSLYLRSLLAHTLGLAYPEEGIPFDISGEVVSDKLTALSRQQGLDLFFQHYKVDDVVKRCTGVFNSMLAGEAERNETETLEFLGRLGMALDEKYSIMEDDFVYGDKITSLKPAGTLKVLLHLGLLKDITNHKDDGQNILKMKDLTPILDEPMDIEEEIATQPKKEEKRGTKRSREDGDDDDEPQSKYQRT